MNSPLTRQSTSPEVQAPGVYRAGAAPGALPLLGHTHRLLMDPLSFLTSLPKYGDLVEIRLGPKPAYVVCHSDLLDHILFQPRTYDKGGPLYEKARLLAGNGLTTCGWADHRRQRPMLQPVFHSRRSRIQATAVREQIEALTAAWRPGQIIDVAEQMHRLTVCSNARALLAENIEPGAINEIQRSLPIVMRGLYIRTVAPFGLLAKFPTPGNRRYERALARLHSVIDCLIDGHRSDAPVHDDLIALLLDHRDQNGKPLPRQEIHDQVITLLLGGQTTAYPLAWIWHLIGRHPEIEDALREEIDRVLAGRLPDFDDVPALDYTRRVITETLRLYPPGWLFSRVTTTPAEIAGRRLPAGTDLLYSAYLLQRRADLFDDPERFDPDRWLPERASTVPRGALVPFGAGNRKCVGDSLAMTVMTLTVSMIAQRWRLRPLNQAQIRPVPKASLGTGELLMTVDPRPATSV